MVVDIISSFIKVPDKFSSELEPLASFHTRPWAKTLAMCLHNLKSSFPNPQYWVSSNSALSPDSFVGNGVKVFDYTNIRGGSIILDNTIIGHGSEVIQTLVMPDSELSHKVTVSGAIIGSNCNIGACVSISPISLFDLGDEKEASISLPSPYHKVQISRFSALIGDKVKIGMNAGMGPGTMIGSNSVVYPMCLLSTQHIAENTVVKLTQSLSYEKLR